MCGGVKKRGCTTKAEIAIAEACIYTTVHRGESCGRAKTHVEHVRIQTTDIFQTRQPSVGSNILFMSYTVHNIYETN